MGGSVSLPLLNRDAAATGNHAGEETSYQKELTPWRHDLEPNSVVRVWDTVMQTSYPAVVTRAGEKDVNLRFCPKYPDGTYCGCVVDQKTTRDAKIVNPYLSVSKIPPGKKQSMINAQCRTESLDHLSEMIGLDGVNKENCLVLTKGIK